MSKHTPGPWKIRRLENALPTHIVGEHNQIITHWDDVLLADAETYEANARLIAAAPDLLIALGSAASILESVASGFKYQGNQEMYEFYTGKAFEARNEIKKAVGGK